MVMTTIDARVPDAYDDDCEYGCADGALPPARTNRRPQTVRYDILCGQRFAANCRLPARLTAKSTTDESADARTLARTCVRLFTLMRVSSRFVGCELLSVLQFSPPSFPGLSLADRGGFGLGKGRKFER